MREVTSREFSRQIGPLQDAAQIEPVVITKHRRRHSVLIGADLFEALMVRARQSYSAATVPDDILAAVLDARMDPKHARLNKLLEAKSRKVR